MHDSLLNLNLLKQTTVIENPFPYLIIPNFINLEYLNLLIDSFPKIESRGSIPASSVAVQPMFQQLINELEGESLRLTIAEKFSTDLHQKPILLTLRSQVSEKDGRIHTDSKSKLITLLLYMNEDWTSETGKLRLLKNKHSLDDYVEEITPSAGSCLIFKVTDNCWHGHHAYVGKRFSIQLNYIKGKFALTKHLNHHRLSACIKKFLKNSPINY